MSEISTDIMKLLVRELEGFRRELAMFPEEGGMWDTVPGVANSAANLALHVAGGLQYLIGSVLGHTGYVRDREAEFNRRRGAPGRRCMPSSIVQPRSSVTCFPRSPTAPWRQLTPSPCWATPSARECSWFTCARTPRFTSARLATCGGRSRAMRAPADRCRSDRSATRDRPLLARSALLRPRHDVVVGVDFAAVECAHQPADWLEQR